MKIDRYVNLQHITVYLTVYYDMTTLLLTLSKRQILDSLKLKEFADDNFGLDENGINIIKRVENPVGKGEIAGNDQFLLFP